MKLRQIATLLCSTACLALAFGQPAYAGHHESGEQATSMQDILAADFRDKDRARDAYRHPAETLAFFGLKPSMAVGEYGPGGGWYTRVIAPMIAPTGKYVALHADMERYNAGEPAERTAKRKQSIIDFPAKVSDWTGVDADAITSVELDDTKDMDGALDAIVMFRGLHGLARKDLTDETIAHFYRVLKSGGMIGMVQHRANEDAAYDYTRGHNGYLKQSEVIAMFESEGFALVKTSEINANEKDAANWDGGVWSLPPTLRHGDTDKAKYQAVGESDRMTLVFRKPG